MHSYGKTARCALASLSFLAKQHKHGTRHGSIEISNAVNIPQPVVAKVLTIVSGHGLVRGTRGKNGGYLLTHAPHQISIHDITSLFEKDSTNDDYCPMGPGWCEVKEECPLHSTITELRNKATNELKKLTLEAFTT
ncbi:MAG: RrF2 family transcriptional regulator [Akkermansiaceae bacterium]